MTGRAIWGNIQLDGGSSGPTKGRTRELNDSPYCLTQESAIIDLLYDLIQHSKHSTIANATEVCTSQPQTGTQMINARVNHRKCYKEELVYIYIATVVMSSVMAQACVCHFINPLGTMSCHGPLSTPAGHLLHLYDSRVKVLYYEQILPSHNTSSYSVSWQKKAKVRNSQTLLLLVSLMTRI